MNLGSRFISLAKSPIVPCFVADLDSATSVISASPPLHQSAGSCYFYGDLPPLLSDFLIDPDDLKLLPTLVRFLMLFIDPFSLNRLENFFDLSDYLAILCRVIAYPAINGEC